MSLIKISILNGFSVATKIICNLAVNKLLAIYIGPSGYAVIGQFQNIVSIFSNLGGGVMGVGVSKMTSQHFDDAAKQHIYWKTAIQITLISSLIAAIILMLVSDVLAKFLQNNLHSIILCLSLAIPGIALNNILLAIINGKKEFNFYILINIATSIFTMLIVLVLTYFYGLKGALAGMVFAPSIMLGVALKFCFSFNWFKVNYIWGGINKLAAKELLSLALMSVTSSIASPLTLMVIRDNLVLVLGLESAGYWQASWKLSETYLMIATTTLSVYFLPRIAEIRGGEELKKEIIKVNTFIIPTTIFIASLIYILRENIVEIVFTGSFMPMIKLFPWQLAGDVIKMASWILSFVMLGRGMIKEFIATEVIFSGTFIFLSHALINNYGLVGASISYAANNFLYYITLYFIINLEVKKLN